MVVEKYNPHWVEQFLTLKEFLEKNTTEYISIEHVGSTSIPGMNAKPIIDIDVIVEDAAQFLKLKKELSKIGYVHEGVRGIPGREAFDHENVPINIDHHLYVCVKDNAELKRHITFRDRLRSNPKLVDEYNKIKEEILAKVGTDNRAGYVQMKEDDYKWFFEKVIASSGNSSSPDSVKTAAAYTGDDLGVTLSDGSITFKTWAPAASTVTLLVYDNISDVGTFDANSVSNKVVGSTTSATLYGSPSAEYAMSRGENNIWYITLDSVSIGSAKYHKYKIVNGGTTYYVSDIWAKAGTPDAIASVIADINTDATATNVTGKFDTAWGSKLAYVNPFTGSYENAVIYEMHITDWSCASTEYGSSVADVGKYSYVASYSVINHLKDIGVTHVQLLPVFEFAETKDNTDYNWGYNPYHYNLPEGRYVINTEDGLAAVCELRKLIAALHDAGIAVIMDVVYNHTSGIGGYSLYDSTVPKYFYRFNADGSYSDGSGCGNEIDSEAPMAKKYIIDSLKHWMLDYHINGFRFDLMGCLSKETMADIYTALYDIDPKVMVYGEPWTGGAAQVNDGATQAVATAAGLGVGVFDDDFRDAIKGAEFGGFKRGQVQDANKDAEIIKGLLGKVGASKRNETGILGLALHYIECHDNYTLFDKLAISKWQDMNDKASSVTTTGDLFTMIGEEGLAAVKAHDKLAAAYVFLSQGTVFINGGQEFLRTKKGQDNSYNLATSYNGIDLSFAITYSDVYNVYKGLIALRKSDPEAFGANTNASASTVSTGVTKYITGDYLVYFNASDATVNVSSVGYTKVIDITSGVVLESTTLPVSVAAKSFLIFKR